MHYRDIEASCPHVTHLPREETVRLSSYWGLCFNPWCSTIPQATFTFMHLADALCKATYSGYTCIVSMSLEHRLLEIISGQLVPELYYLWLGDFMLECGRIEKKHFFYKKFLINSSLSVHFCYYYYFFTFLNIYTTFRASQFAPKYKNAYKCIKSDSKDIYNVKKDMHFK